jgi:lysophospholipase L1-like esterase
MPDAPRDYRCFSVFFALLLATTALAACSSTKSPSAPSPPTSPPTLPSGDLLYTALGASDAIGFGGSQPCIPFSSCEGASGYIPIIADRLEVGRVVTVSNLGLPAAVISAEIEAIGVAYGRTIPGNFIEREMPFVPRMSNLITIFAGGNDVNAIAAALRGGAGGTNPIAYADARISGFGTDYQTLIDGIRGRAANARIVVANLPNFAGLPLAASLAIDRKQALQKLSVGFSLQGINTLISRSVVVVDLLCDARSYDPAIYSSDGFHPNDRGYQYMAERFLAAITSTSTSAPSSNCAQMRLVPPI